MQAFEFHFNPKEKEDLIFDSFCFIPENIYEKRMGGIFMLGELKNPLPHNYKLLEKTATAVKKEFYSKFQRTEEQSLKESLKRSNELLAQEVAKENTDWLGNLNFAIISLKNFDLNFTKVGSIKMFLIRGPHIIDIGSKLDSQEIEPYPLKIFNNIVSGKLRENDIVLAISEKIFPVLKNILNEIANLPARPTGQAGAKQAMSADRQGISAFDEKKIKDLIRAREKELADISGAFVLISASKLPTTFKRPKIIFQKEIEKLQIAQVFSLILKYSKKAAAFFKKIPTPPPAAPPNAPVKIKVKVPSFKAPSLKFKLPARIAMPASMTAKLSGWLRSIAGRPALRLPAFKMPPFRAPVFNNFERSKKLSEGYAISRKYFSELKNDKIFKKKFRPVLIFIFVLAIGFFIFKGR